MHGEALRRLAWIRRRDRRPHEAAEAWNELAVLPRCAAALRREAKEALAIHHEHRLKDLQAARQHALDLLAEGVANPARVQHRLDRLERKLARYTEAMLPADRAEPELPTIRQGQIESPAMDEQPGLVARAALRLTAWTERWIPDAFIFALLATILVFIAALIWTPSSPLQVVDAWGNGFWDLIPFTLQMSLIIITGHVLATSAPMGKAIRAIAGWPRTPRGAVALVTFFAMFDVVVQLGLQPDLQRGAGEGGGAARRRRRLPRARGGEHARHRQHLGAGPQRIGGAADGHARRAAAADPRHRRRRRPGAGRHHPVPRHDLPLAKLRLGRRSRSSSSCW